MINLLQSNSSTFVTNVLTVLVRLTKSGFVRSNHISISDANREAVRLIGGINHLVQAFKNAPYSADLLLSIFLNISSVGTFDFFLF